MVQQIKAKYRRDYHPPEYTISNINLTFHLDAQKTVVIAVSQVIRQINASVPLRLDGKNLKLISLQINNQAWTDYKEEQNQLVINNVPKNFTLYIVNEISPIYNTAMEGLYQSGSVLCTQCEAEGFRHITWYLDRPDVLARFTTKIIADKSRYPFLLSNGNQIGTGELENNQHWIQWQDPIPKPCYLFAMVAGDFDVLSDIFVTRSNKRVILKIFVDHGKIDWAHWAMTSLINSMKWDEERFNLEYDLDIYMIVAVDFFNMGAMENKGLNIFNSKYILASANTATDKDYLDIERVIGHEYFHNWTGNRVTCRDWFQLSLKEGLTVFRDQEFSSDLGSRSINRIRNVRTMRSLQFAEDASPMAHPIRPDKVIEINNFYTITVYEKGAEIIRMIHTLLGETNFQKGMQLYFKRHDGSAVTCEDFVQAMEDASSIDLSYFRRWYSQSGTPIVTVKDNYNVETKQYTLIISQHTPPTTEQKEKLPLHIPISITLYDHEGKIIPLQQAEYNSVYYVLNLTQSEQTFTFDNVYSKPFPALLCEFSAPVKLEYNWNDQQLIFLMHHAHDDFSRWDSAQNLIATYFKLNVNRYQQGSVLSLPVQAVNAFRAILLDKSIDPALAAEILTLPSTTEIIELFDIIDPIAIVKVREALVRIMANEMYEEFHYAYNANKIDTYCIKHTDIGKRSLRNICLYYLAFGDTQTADILVTAQYKDSDNMTDILSALSTSVASELPCCDFLMQDYDNKWYQNGLVMDKWFTLQATRPSNTLNKIRSLLTHRSFNISNPNRVRSLIGAFANNNLLLFHALDGSGYQFIVKILTELNTLNPQLAARLIEPLIQLKRYDIKRQNMMRTALEQLKGLVNISSNLYEKIARTLD